MEREKSWEIITKTGVEIRDRIKKLADNNNLKISSNGIAALTDLQLKVNSLEQNFNQSRNAFKGYLANTVYVCTEHTQKLSMATSKLLMMSLN